jgi:hypothetical protein
MRPVTLTAMDATAREGSKATSPNKIRVHDPQRTPTKDRTVIAIDWRKIGDSKEKAFDIIYETLAALQKEAERTDVEVELAVEKGYGEGWAFVVRWIFKDEEDDTGVCVTGFTERKYAKQFLDEFKAYAAKRYGRRFDSEPPVSRWPIGMIRTTRSGCSVSGDRELWIAQAPIARLRRQGGREGRGRL